MPQRQQHFSMCFEYLDALSPKGIALHKILQKNVFTRGIMSLFFQTCLKIVFTWLQTGAGPGIPSSMRTCKQILYADLELHFPFGVSFSKEYQAVQFFKIVVLLIISAVLGRKRVSMS
jgi:hypothetical protein